MKPQKSPADPADYADKPQNSLSLKQPVFLCPPHTHAQHFNKTSVEVSNL